MRNAVITRFEQRVFKKKNYPQFTTGDTINVHYRIFEGEGKKARIQQFEGVVITYRKGTADASFTVRKISSGGIGVERIFPYYSPNIEKLEVRAKGQVRRSRLFYLRDRSGKAARIRSRFGGLEAINAVDQTEGDLTAPAVAEAKAETPAE